MAGYKKWNTNDVLTSTDLNGYLGSQVVYQFATTAARDAAITGANLVDGMICYVRSGDSSEGLYAYNGANWRKGPGWNAPWGVRSVKTDTVDRVATTTMAELTTNLRTTETYIANRYLRFTVEMSLDEITNTTAAIIEIYNVTTSTVVRRIYNCPDLITSQQVSNSCIAASASGAVYTVRIQGIGHAFNVLSATTQSARLTVEDIGPSGAPL